MAEEEICLVMGVNLASKKRAASSVLPEEHLHPTKKRAVLGELTNVSLNQISVSESEKPKPRSVKKDLKPVAKSDPDDPLMCVPYASDICGYLHNMEIEPKRRPFPYYFEMIQRDATPNMRCILVDWLVEVAEDYKLLSDTLYLSVSYLDRFLSKVSINRNKLQLLGVSCMLIASKYEEISPPHVEDFCFITDNAYTKKNVVKMEADVLKSLNFEIGNPTIKTFLDRFTTVAKENCKLHKQFNFLGFYLAELSLLDYDCVKFLPSMVAASVIFVAKFTLQPKIHPWDMTLERSTGYKASDLKDCVLIIHDLQWSRRGYTSVAVRAKYKKPKFNYVATLMSPLEIPAVYFRC